MTTEASAPEQPAIAVALPRATQASRRVGLALLVLALVTLGPIVAPLTAQPASRFALTAALADHHTVDLGAYRNVLEIDHARYRGRLRSDKAPGQPLLAVPFYWLARLAGAEPASRGRVVANLSLWWLTFWTATVPFALLLWLMHRAASRRVGAHATAAAVSLAGATILLPHAVNLYGHALSALLGYAGYLAIGERGVAPRQAAVSGALLGSAITVEYHLAIVAIVVAAVVWHRERAKLAWFGVGAAPPLIVLAAYQWRAFGSPLHTPFAYYAGSLGGTTHGGFSMPTPRGLFDLFFADRGMLAMNPVVVVGIVAAMLLCRRPGAPRGDAAVALAVMAGYIVLVAGWSGTPWLEEPGPRYLIPAIPFLAVPLAACWTRLRSIARLAAAWGGFFMGAAAVTLILVATNDTPFNAYVNRVANRRFAPTLWSLTIGRAGIALYISCVGAALVALGAAVRAARPEAGMEAPAN